MDVTYAQAMKNCKSQWNWIKLLWICIKKTLEYYEIIWLINKLGMVKHIQLTRLIDIRFIAISVAQFNYLLEKDYYYSKSIWRLIKFRRIIFHQVFYEKKKYVSRIKKSIVPKTIFLQPIAWDINILKPKWTWMNRQLYAVHNLEYITLKLCCQNEQLYVFNGMNSYCFFYVNEKQKLSDP